MSVLDAEIIKVANLFGGEEAVTVVKVLQKLKDGTDEQVANESQVRLNTVRKVLYRLYDHGLVSCQRERDERTGWYIFHWKLQPDQLDAFIRSRKKRTLDKLRHRLDFERNHSFFVCRNDAEIRITFEEAMESSFKCTKCGSQLENRDNSGPVMVLEQKIKKIEAELSQ